MAGVRIHHPTLRHALLAVPSTRPFAAPKWCSQCSETHQTKHYHVVLDGDGDAIVSTTVWERIRQIGSHPFLVMNEVDNPPEVQVGFHRDRQREERRVVKQIGDAIHDLAPPGTRVTITRSR